MKRMNLSFTSSELKIGLSIRKFYGEGSHRCNANVQPGDIIPVLVNNDNNEMYLHTMKWGIDIFNNGNNLTHNARSEGIRSNASWGPLIKNGNRCVIICKGFYIWNVTEIYDISSKIIKKEKQPYYIEPDHQYSSSFFYIAAIYRKQRKYTSISYSVCPLTMSSENDIKYRAYVQRIPFFLKWNDVKLWLNKKYPINNILKQKTSASIIKTKPFLKIGLWVNNPSKYKNENIILQSKFDWDLEIDAKNIGFMDNDFAFDQIEKDALKQNNANKLGIKYDNKNNNWDNFKNNNNNNNNYDDDTDKELKEEEEHNNRKRNRIDTDIDNDNDINIYPPHKKQKLSTSLNDAADQFAAAKSLISNDINSQKRRRRRSSLSDKDPLNEINNTNNSSNKQYLKKLKKRERRKSSGASY